jgi:hypothetical protein
MISIRLSSLLAVLLLAGCTTVQYRPVPLPLPARPVLTPVKASDVACLAPDVYTALVNRERALKEWGLAEEAVLKANNAKAKQ